MTKMKLCALTILTSILLSGCSGRLDKPRRPQTLNPSAAPIMYTVDQYKKDFQEYTIAFKTNVATFEDVPLGVSVPDLVLVEVPAGQNAVSIIADQLSQGKTIVFHERVFVSGVEKEVLGFR